MAVSRKAPARKKATKGAKPAKVEAEVEEIVTKEPTTKSIIDEGIKRVVDELGIDIQKARYKAMRAIAFQAFSESIEAGDFEALVERAIENASDLPAGWGTTSLWDKNIAKMETSEDPEEDLEEVEYLDEPEEVEEVEEVKKPAPKKTPRRRRVSK